MMDTNRSSGMDGIDLECQGFLVKTKEAYKDKNGAD